MVMFVYTMCLMYVIEVGKERERSKACDLASQICLFLW